MRDLIAIADAGGTKTSWWIFDRKTSKESFFETKGINASVNTLEQITVVFYEFQGKLTDIIDSEFNPDKAAQEFTIHALIYAAGCNSEETKRRIVDGYAAVFGDTGPMPKCKSDLEGAARAVNGDERGIVCIIGTGSIAGLYDGRQIIDVVPSLGYVLGDEGSGAFMGKKLLNLYFKRQLCDELKVKLENTFTLSVPEVIDKVYRSASPNSYLGSFMHFVNENENHPQISNLIDNSLKLFFEKNVVNYIKHNTTRIGFVGGVAYNFADKLCKISKSYGFESIRIIKSPITELAKYYKLRYEI